MTSPASSVRSAASQAGDHPVVEKGARLGFAASGLLHLLIAWVALQVAWTSSGGEASQEGALQTLAGSAVGSVLLWLTVVGFAFLALWQLTEAVVRGSAGDRLKAGGKAVVYAVLAWTALNVVQGSGGGGSEESTTASLMQNPGGRVLVGAVGLGVVGVGVYHVVKGWSARFLRDLREHPGTWTVRLGRIGYIAKGGALVLVGALLVAAAATARPDQAQGLDGALRTLLEVPAGKIVLTAVALGIAAYGLYSFARARFGRV